MSSKNTERKLTREELDRWYRALEGKTDEHFSQYMGGLARFKGDICQGMCCLGVFLHVNDSRPWSDMEHGQELTTYPDTSKEEYRVGEILDNETWGKRFAKTFSMPKIKAEAEKMKMPISVAYRVQQAFALLNDGEIATFKDIARIARKAEIK